MEAVLIIPSDSLEVEYSIKPAGKVATGNNK